MFVLCYKLPQRECTNCVAVNISRLSLIVGKYWRVSQKKSWHDMNFFFDFWKNLRRKIPKPLSCTHYDLPFIYVWTLTMITYYIPIERQNQCWYQIYNKDTWGGFMFKMFGKMWGFVAFSSLKSLSPRGCFKKTLNLAFL